MFMYVTLQSHTCGACQRNHVEIASLCLRKPLTRYTKFFYNMKSIVHVKSYIHYETGKRFGIFSISNNCMLYGSDLEFLPSQIFVKRTKYSYLYLYND